VLTAKSSTDHLWRLCGTVEKSQNRAPAESMILQDTVAQAATVFRTKARKLLTRRSLALLLGIAGRSLAAQTETPNYEKYLLQGVQFEKEQRYSNAEKAYVAALCEAEQQFGPEHFYVADVLIHLGALRTQKHDYSGALAAFERSLSITEKTFGSQNVAVGLVLTNIAEIYHKQERYGMAEPLYRRALAILETSVGRAHRYTAIAETGMAMLRLVQHRNSEAEELLERAIPVLESSHQTDDPTLLIALTNLAEAYRIDGRYGKAEPLYRRSLAMVESRPVLITQEVSLGLVHFPVMLRKMKRKAEARELEMQMKSILPKR
jgi:tetratricopeptide (TPR) repeat protein